MGVPARIDAKLPQTYVAARQALAKCERVDECKKWRDKMAALASYGKQSGDDTLFRLATEIKQRAIRRAGEILAQIEPKPGKRTDKPNIGSDARLTRKEAATAAGLSKRQREEALQVAAIPEPEFEAAIKRTPTTKDLADLGKKKYVEPKPYRTEYLVWIGAVGTLAKIPACGLAALAKRMPVSNDDNTEEAKAALKNLQLWLKELEA